MSKKIRVVIMNFEQIGHEEYKIIPRTKLFTEDATVKEINDWIKSIDKSKDITTSYISPEQD